MIDINELRRLALDGDLAAMQEIILRLEAAEQDAIEQARLNGMGAERELALMAKLEVVEKERDSLRTKIECMEQQEPAGEVVHNGESAGLYDILKQGALLYALPGAQGE